MMLPELFGTRNYFDDLFDFPAFRGMDEIEKKLYGNRSAHIMKTDVKEMDDGYEAAINLPGFKKDEINIKLENGYLSVSAVKAMDKNEKDKKGKIIRQERYSGSMQRSFFVGNDITEEDVKAKFEDGVLTLQIPKKEPVIPEKKTIMIEG